MTNPHLTDTTFLKAGSEQISRVLGNDVIILHLVTGKCYSLNAIGKRVWELLQEPRTVQQLTDTLLAEYEVEPETCRRDLFSLLTKLANVRLIEIEPHR